MGVSRAWPLMLGAITVASGTAMVTFDIIFAVTLSRASSPSSTRVAAIVASGTGSVTVAIFLLLWGSHFRHRNHIQDLGQGRQHTYLLAGFGGVFAIMSAVASAVVMGIMRSRISELPKRTIRSSTSSIITGGFIVWAITLLSQALFVICMIVIQRKDFQQQIRAYRPEAPQTLSDMHEAPRPRATSVQGNSRHRESASMESKSPPSSSGRSPSGSDTVASSFRSSLTQVVRPITSKTKLINHKAPYRSASIESNPREVIASIEDGFDSWDTSAVDAQSRQAVESASPTPRFLETIPASPTTSRSASPGFPLDLEPPKPRRRSRSYSPANSYRDRTRTTSPTESTREAHIHPLFRSDSPTPPPAATPGTIVTAAPGAGQVLSDRASVRSLSRMRSGSLPASPSMHSDSLDSIRKAMEREEREKLGDGGERTLTPPIPDWVLGAGPRSSMTGYTSRKKTQTGLGIVGEVGNA